MEDLSNAFQLEFDGRVWDADAIYYSIVSLDDDSSFLIGIHAYRSGMDMDTANRGWDLRLFIELPAEHPQRDVMEFAINENALHGAILILGDEEFLVGKGIIRFSGKYVGAAETLEWHSFQGSFELTGPDEKPFNGSFQLVHNEHLNLDRYE